MRKKKRLVGEVAKEKEGIPQRKINLLPQQYSNEYTHLISKSKYTDHRILEMTERLDKKFQNKVLMAIEISELYDSGNKQGGDSDKEDFAYQYGIETKIC